MNLEQLQRKVFDVIRQPLTPKERMNPRTPDGRSTKKIVDAIIKPNDRLTSVERLEIYNQVYWFRILSALAEDFPGLRAIIGQKRFDQLLVAYLAECPSESFSLRNLGARLEKWLLNHLQFAPRVERLALDMVRLEWADIEAFDGAELPKLQESDLRNLGDDPTFHLQPYLLLLELAYPVDEFLLTIRGNEDQHSDIVSNVVTVRAPKRRGGRLALPKPEKVYLAVHRCDDCVYFKRLEPEGFALLRALQQGKPLSQAIEASVNWSNRPVEEITGKVQHWFANWANLGWFCHAPQKGDKS
ncbi:MAG TPA: DNA-binding domain-containing protein [Alphaproteobacteria bacterium]|nr:DNA-binding domain-containing protein [Alphaproteobacteria bacterium]